MEIVAVTKDGERRRRDGATLWDDEKGITRNADAFQNSVADIDHFEYRLRPIRYRITFQHISLRAKQKTAVKMNVEKVPIRVQDQASVSPDRMLPESKNVYSLRFVDESSLRSIAYGEGKARQGHYPRVRQWDFSTKKMSSEVPLQWEDAWIRYIDSMVFTHDSQRIIGSMGDQLGVWDASTGKLLRRLDSNWRGFGELTLHSIATSKNGDRIACAGITNRLGLLHDGLLYVWDKDRNEVRAITSEATGDIRSMAMSEDGKRLAAWPAKGGVGIWDLDSGDQVLQFANSNPPGSAPFPEKIPGSTRTKFSACNSHMIVERRDRRSRWYQVDRYRDRDAFRIGPTPFPLVLAVQFADVCFAG
ncbi:MAG: hypothetical protein R3C05_14490 [Pirellulaceae bacterium]